MRLKLLLAAAAASFIATGASAQTATYVDGAAAPSSGFTLFNGFNTAAEQAAVTGTNYIFQSDSNGQGAAPAAAGGTPYLSVLGGGTATLSLGGFNPHAIQFDWGSTDTYNTLTVNTLTGSFNFAPGSGAVTANSSGLFTFNAGSDRVTSVTFASSQNSFELDNFSLNGAVPEPATWALMIMGFGVVGGAMRRRQSSALATA